MKVGIVGAGISGLAAARDLTKNGHSVVVYERNREVGGRCMTRECGPYRWDTGATSIAPRGKRIEHEMLAERPTDELIKIAKPIYTHASLRVSPGDPRKNVDRYVYAKGISTFARLLAAGLEVRTQHVVDDIKRVDSGYEIDGQRYDAIILTAPVPQTALVLWSIGETRPVSNVRYRTSVSIMVAFDTPMPKVPYFALIEVDQHHPLVWVSIETEKSPVRAPEGHTLMTLQLNPTFSAEYFDRSDEWLVDLAANFVHQLFPKAFGEPVAGDVMKWKYASPEALASFEKVNENHQGLIVTGDAFFGGRIEDAYESGLRASELLRASS